MIEHLKNCDYESSNWTGGKTRQIAIYPKNAVYKQKKFIWRLSSATIECKESAFTKLEEYTRYIASLDKSIKLVHTKDEKETSVILNPLELHYFDGADNTKAFGKCTDFNLILRKGKCEATIDLYNTIDPFDFWIGDKKDFVLIYCIQGKVEVNLGDEIVTAKSNETILVYDEAGSMKVNPEYHSSFYLANIKLL